MEEPRTLPQLLDASVAAHASRTAIVTLEVRWSYAELGDRVDRLARALVAQGVGKGSRVGILMENLPDWVAFAFAATGIGAVFIPVSTFSKQDDVEYQLRHADVSHLFLSARFLKNDYLGMLRHHARNAIKREVRRCAVVQLGSGPTGDSGGDTERRV